MDYTGKQVKVIGVNNEASLGRQSLDLTGEVLLCEKGRGLAITFPTGDFLKTSKVIDITPTENYLKIETLNSEYHLKIEEEK